MVVLHCRGVAYLVLVNRSPAKTNRFRGAQLIEHKHSIFSTARQTSGVWFPAPSRGIFVLDNASAQAQAMMVLPALPRGDALMML